MRKILFAIFLSFFLTNFSIGQNFVYEFHGIVEDNDMPIKDVTIRAYQEQQMVINQATLGNGYYKLKLNFNSNYFLEFSKEGYKPKRIFISTEISNQITSTLESDFYTINLEQGESIGEEKVTYLQLNSFSGKLVQAGDDFINNKITQAEKKANEIIAIAHYEADSIVNSAKIEEKNIIENYKDFQIKKDSIANNKDEIFEEYVQNNPNAVANNNYSASDSLLVIKELIAKGYKDIENLEKQLLEAKNSNDSSKIIELQKEHDKLTSLTNAYEEQAKWYKTQIDIKDLKIEKKKNTVTFLFIVSILFVLILITLIILFRNKRQANILINEKNKNLNNTNKKITEQKTRIETANYLIQKKNELLEIQKKEIQDQHYQITSSVKYAKNIQTAVLPSLDQLKEHVDAFDIFLPKDIVSGDFYWNFNMKGYNFSSIIAVIDCTGHGVSGAFMSMISYSLLNYIVKELEIYEPKKILERLDKEVVISLRQNETNNMDGMDMCICKISEKENKTIVNFSGAKRPLYLYDSATNEVSRIKGTRRSIGGNRIVKNIPDFETVVIETEKNDSIYMTSDGFIDQSNSERKRFGSQAFTNVLLKNNKKTMSEQKKVLLAELHKHQGSTAQRDDITMIGIKF